VDSTASLKLKGPTRASRRGIRAKALRFLSALLRGGVHVLFVAAVSLCLLLVFLMWSILLLFDRP